MFTSEVYHILVLRHTCVIVHILIDIFNLKDVGEHKTSGNLYNNFKSWQIVLYFMSCHGYELTYIWETRMHACFFLQALIVLTK